MRLAPTLLTPLRRDRYVTWARLMLLWVSAALFGAVRFNRRHIKQRYGLLWLGDLERMVCNLTLIRAVELARVPLDDRRRHVRRFARPGFRRPRINDCERVIFGSRLRRHLRCADSYTRIARMLDALADLDAFTRRYFLKRIQRKLTKLCPVVAVRPPAHGFASATAPAPLAADSS